MGLLGPQHDALKTDRLAMRVSREVARRLIELHDAAGEVSVPSQAELAEEYGISEVVAREALNELASARLIATRPGRRAQLQPIEEWDHLSPTLLEVSPPRLKRMRLMELIEVRELLEPPIAQQAALRADEETRQKLRDLGQRMLQSEHDRDQYAELDAQFHTALASVADNTILIQTMNSLGRVMRASFDVNLMHRESIEDATRGHLAIIQAVCEGDGPGAFRAMADHLATTRRNYRWE